MRLLFVTLLAKANSIGFVEASTLGLARVANLSQQEIEDALVVLQAPDPHSKNPDLEGRRIARVPGGWMVLNYEEYRSRTTEEERRQYMREYMRKYRKMNGGKQPVNNVKKSKDLPSASSSIVSDKMGCKGRCTQSEAEQYCVSLGLPHTDGTTVFEKWQGNGWINGKTPIRDWKATIRSWKLQGFMPSQKPKESGRKPESKSGLLPQRKIWDTIAKMEEEAKV